MSISLNNHESRITSLEKYMSDNGQTWTQTEGCILYDRTGLKIQWGVYNSGGYPTITFPRPFETDGFICMCCGLWSTGSTGADGAPHIRWRDRTQCQLDAGTYSPALIYWIAIGILYTYRYIIKSAQKFTPLSYLFNKEV